MPRCFHNEAKCPSGTALVYSTYLGGTAEDKGRDIAIDKRGHVYVTGSTRSPDYDVTPWAFQKAHGGGNYDVFVTRLCLEPFAEPPKIRLTSAAGTNNQTVQVVGIPISAISYATTKGFDLDVIGLPKGVTFSFNAKMGILTIHEASIQVGTFNYTAILTGCGTAVAKGTITVKSSP